MTDAVQQDVKTDVKVEDKQAVAPEFTKTEQEAIKYGWKPQDQWEGEVDDFRPAKEFMERSSFFKKINDLNRKIDQGNSALQALQQSHALVHRKAYEQAMVDLKAEHRAAVEAGDGNAADKVLDKMDSERQKAVVAQQAAAVQVPQNNAEFDEFREKNSAWYGEQGDDVMTIYADRAGFDYVQGQVAKGIRPTNQSVFDHVEKKVRDKFPDRFGSTKRAAPSPVGPSGSPTPRPKVASKHSEADLPEEAVTVMRNLLKQKDSKGKPLMTKEQYLTDFFGERK